MDIAKTRKWIFLIVVLVLLIPFLSKISFFYTVGYGKAAIVSRFGKIDRVSEPGLHFKLPLFEDVELYSTQKIVYETSDRKSVV